MEYPHVEMTDENKETLASAIAQSIASSGRDQYEVAWDGFVGINEMTQEQFNYAWFYYVS